VSWTIGISKREQPKQFSEIEKQAGQLKKDRYR
jgi:hypothetical protein